MESEHIESSLVIGRGEVGKSLFAFLREMKANVFIRDIRNLKVPQIDVLHIAFPYSDDFTAQVRSYIELYDPQLTIIYSTVPIGVTEDTGHNIVHSPIEGRHPNLEASIASGVRWLGCANKNALADAVMFWKPYVKTIRTVNSASHTEFLKLRSTAKYGVNLVWADYEAGVAKKLEMDFDALKQFDLDYNVLYMHMGLMQFQRYLLDPPNGEIGGHCVVPNAELLDVQFPHPMLGLVKDMKPKKKDKK